MKSEVMQYSMTQEGFHTLKYSSNLKFVALATGRSENIIQCNRAIRFPSSLSFPVMFLRWVKCCVYSMVLSLQPDRSGVGNVGACLLADSGLEGVGGQCVTVWPYVCLYLGGLVTWGQDARLWSLIYCGGFMWLWLSHTLATLFCFHLQSFSWIKMGEGGC